MPILQYIPILAGRLLPVTHIPVLEVHATTCAAQSLGSGWPKSLLNPTKRSNLPRDAVIMQKFAETCAWSDFWSPPPLKRLLFPSEFCETANISILAGAGARRKIPMYCQYLLESSSIFKINTCWDPIQSFYRALVPLHSCIT